MSVFENVPNDVLIAIFLHVPAVELVRHCSLVCRQWFDALSGRYFWVQKIESEGSKISEKNRQLLLDHEDDDLCLYILMGLASGILPFNRNLIKNPCGQDSRKHWLYKEKTSVGSKKARLAIYEDEPEIPRQLTEQLRRQYPNDQHPEVYLHSHHGFSIERKPIGTEPVPEEAGVPTQHCFVNSFSLGVRTQFIDLTKYKMRDAMMELLKPTIHYSQWVAARYDSASQADLYLLFICGKEKMSLPSVHWDTNQEGIHRRTWYKMEGRAEVPSSVDGIVYRSTGSDLMGWAGNFGSKTTACSLVLQI
ncbi:F-box only protein 27-like [Convolutriloba macropyga]|uniref:F-box only protein 27-like n=1 Tax=Convolutriloba macropyga TaxID=536237 RepID=UPI003F5201B4